MRSRDPIRRKKLNRKNGVVKMIVEFRYFKVSLCTIRQKFCPGWRKFFVIRL